MIKRRKRGIYERIVKRFLDIVCSLLAIIVFSWLYLFIAIIVRIKMGSPVIFKQPRPGLIDPRTGQERIFDMYKFRTMTNDKDENGKLLPDDKRLPKFGKLLRATSLDELPEAFNILKGDMSVIGPRPQLVRDMVFMSAEQRMRHTTKPGLSGLAQVKGRNSISWDDKLSWDLKYIEKINFIKDFLIVLDTIKVAFIKKEGITDGNNATALDYGDELLKNGKVNLKTYNELQDLAKRIISERE